WWAGAARCRVTPAARSPSDDPYRQRGLYGMLDIFQVFVEDVFLAVGQLQELFPGPAEGGLRQVVTELGQPELKGMPPRPRREHDAALAHPHIFGPHDLVGEFVFENAVLVDPGGVGERVGAHHRLVGLYRDPGMSR